jgi:hypothetical protein
MCSSVQFRQGMGAPTRRLCARRDTAMPPGPAPWRVACRSREWCRQHETAATADGRALRYARCREQDPRPATTLPTFPSGGFVAPRLPQAATVHPDEGHETHLVAFVVSGRAFAPGEPSQGLQQPHPEGAFDDDAGSAHRPTLHRRADGHHAPPRSRVHPRPRQLAVGQPGPPLPGPGARLGRQHPGPRTAADQRRTGRTEPAPAAARPGPVQRPRGRTGFAPGGAERPGTCVLHQQWRGGQRRRHQAGAQVRPGASRRRL